MGLLCNFVNVLFFPLGLASLILIIIIIIIISVLIFVVAPFLQFASTISQLSGGDNPPELEGGPKEWAAKQIWPH